ncbi:MAG: prepilin-type N-terminal cleavage/methylation domain-containing protein [Phycisphaerae bacterium]|nr:prepilin-type N-terminal cleavage/methylation domain-containing protein [Phycisphaerae bacterium]
MKQSRIVGFTLIEVILVVSLLAVLLTILVPTLQVARCQVRGTVCRNHLRQLTCANLSYTVDNDGFFVPGAKDLWNQAGLYRWHGVRDSRDLPFNPIRGPLASYLDTGRINECPERIRFVRGGLWEENFEQGCGGYGYNMTYLGSRLWEGIPDPVGQYERTTRTTEVASAGRTLMFADCALSRQDGSYIEYSFAEPPFCVVNGRVMTGFYMSPTLHFRHHARANIGWADGHVDAQQMAPMDSVNAYGIESATMFLGWFDPADNSPFDLK